MKSKTQYVCQNCGHTSAKWLGRCPGCEAWHSLVEERTSAGPDPSARVSTRDSILKLTGFEGQKDFEALEDESEDAAHVSERYSTGISELDRVLGGGLVKDSFVLLGGDPGIGKSTLLLQMAKGLVASNSELRILYVSGEESTSQIRSRAKRLEVAGNSRIFLSAETVLERALASVKELRPDVLMLDSLQTFASGTLESAPGSVSQVREISSRLMNLAKSAKIAVCLVGHVTKEGNIAGPKTVEHMVDTVLYFEAEAGQSYRLLRAVKNRFGSSMELGVFEMDGEGLREIGNPSSLFLGERKAPVQGVAVTAALEGTRPLLVELQALVTKSTLAMPRRTAVGLESAKVSLLSAILEKHLKIPLFELDLFFNVAGGLKLSEPASDLAACAAIWSSIEERPLPNRSVFMGEVSLTGEVRRISFPEVRVEEAKKIGFKAIFLPQGNLERCQKISGVELIGLNHIHEFKDYLGYGAKG